MAKLITIQLTMKVTDAEFENNSSKFDTDVIDEIKSGKFQRDMMKSNGMLKCTATVNVKDVK